MRLGLIQSAVIAQICVNRKHKNLGRFDTPEQAYAAYLDAKRLMHDGCTL